MRRLRGGLKGFVRSPVARCVGAFGSRASFSGAPGSAAVNVGAVGKVGAVGNAAALGAGGGGGGSSRPRPLPGKSPWPLEARTLVPPGGDRETASAAVRSEHGARGAPERGGARDSACSYADARGGGVKLSAPPKPARAPSEHQLPSKPSGTNVRRAVLITPDQGVSQQTIASAQGSAPTKSTSLPRLPSHGARATAEAGAAGGRASVDGDRSKPPRRRQTASPSASPSAPPPISRSHASGSSGGPSCAAHSVSSRALLPGTLPGITGGASTRRATWQPHPSDALAPPFHGRMKPQMGAMSGDYSHGDGDARQDVAGRVTATKGYPYRNRAHLHGSQSAPKLGMATSACAVAVDTPRVNAAPPSLSDHGAHDTATPRAERQARSRVPMPLVGLSETQQRALAEHSRRLKLANRGPEWSLAARFRAKYLSQETLLPSGGASRPQQ